MEKIGLFVSQSFDSSVSEFQIKYNGVNLDNYSDLLTSALLKGYLENRIDEPINYINAKITADEIGLHVTESVSSKDKIYQTLIEVKASNKSNQVSVSGTIGLNGEIRIVSLDNYNIDLVPEGKMIIYYNIDKPGVLAKVSQFLAAENINIAGVFLGRKDKGSQALTVMKVDDVITEKSLLNIKKIEEIDRVICVNI